MFNIDLEFMMYTLGFFASLLLTKRVQLSKTTLGTTSLVFGETFDTLGTSLGPRMTEILSSKHAGLSAKL
jgi:hypothetical protein